MSDTAKWFLEFRRAYVERLQRDPKRVGSQGTAELNRAIVRWLESCRYHDVAPPEELIHAVKRQLKVDRRNRNEPAPQKRMAAIEACVRDPGISDSKLAQICGVSRPTIAMWKRDDSFNFPVAFFRKFFDANPKLKAEIVANPHLTWDDLFEDDVKSKGR